MEDIISQGDDRRPPSRRAKLVIAVALAAVAALVVVDHLPHGAPARTHPPHVAIPAQHGQRSFPVRLRVEGPATLPNGVTGPTVVWAGSARLPLTGPRPTWFWPAKGRIRPITGLPSDRYGYLFTRVGGGWAVLPDEVGSASFGPAVPVFYLATGSNAAEMIGVADQAAPAVDQHSLWLVNYPPHVPLVKAVGVAQEFTANGLSVGGLVLLPAGYELVRGTKNGLLLAPVLPSADGRTVQLWDPATGQFSTTFNAVVATSADSIAYTTPRCASACPVHVRNLVTGYKLTIRAPAGHAVTSAAFSPDGRYLALEVSAGESSDGETLEVQLEVASLATGHLTVLPHTWATGEPLTGLGWPGNGDHLVVELNTGSEVQMAFWAPGERTVAIADIGAHANAADIIVG